MKKIVSMIISLCIIFSVLGAFPTMVFAETYGKGDIIHKVNSSYLVKSENLIYNGDFSNGLDGWYTGSGNAASSDYFSVSWNGTVTCNVADSWMHDGSLWNTWRVSVGKKYIFRFTSSRANEYFVVSTKDEYIAPNDAGKPDGRILHRAHGGTNEVIFTADSNYVQIVCRWFNGEAVGNFEMYEIEATYEDASDIVIKNGGTYYIKSENLIYNGDFTYGLRGWQTGAGTSASGKYFNVNNNGTVTCNTSDGKMSEASLLGIWPLDKGKIYALSYYSSKANEYCTVSIKGNSDTINDGIIINRAGAGNNSVIFRASDSYLQILSRWMEGISVGKFELYEVSTSNSIPSVDKPSGNRPTEVHDLVVEVRDAETNRLIPETRISVFLNASNAKFYTLWDGKTTLKNVSFPIYGLSAFSSGYDCHRTLKNIEYPGNGKIVIKLTSFKTQEVAVQGVHIFNKIDKLTLGDTHQLEANVSPINATNQEITWSSSDISVATVDDTGLVTGVRNGTAKISVMSEDGGFKDSIKITVSNGAILTSFENVAYSFKNQTKRIPLKIYQDVFGDFGGLIEYNRDKEKGTYGVCAGMVNTSLMFYNDYREYENYGGENIRQLDFSNKKVKNFIWYMYLSQNKAPFEIAREINGAYHNPSDKRYDNISAINRLANYAQKELLYISIGSKMGGHALLSYGITMNTYFQGKRCSLLWVYDCNFPDDTKLIALYKDEGGEFNGEWAYIGYDYPFNSEQENSRISFIRYDEIIRAAECGKIQLMSLDENDITNFTFIQNSSNMLLTDINENKLSLTNGVIQECDIENYVYFDEYYISNNSNRITLSNGQYTVSGHNEEGVVETIAYNSANSIHTTTINDAKIIFNIQNFATDGADSDSFVNIDNNSVLGDYSITYMPFNSAYNYNYDTITISGNTDGVVNTNEKDGNVYVSGVDKFEVLVAVGDETVSSVAENLNKESIYCVKVEKNDGVTTVHIVCENTEITDSVEIPEKQQVAQPSYNIESGEYDEKQILELIATDEAISLYYTTDGSEPMEDISMLYTEPIEVNQSMTIKVLATKYGYENSDILTLEYTLPDVTIPVPTLFSGEYGGIQQVELVADNGANIYYTTDGSDPLYTGELYTSPIITNKDMTIKTYANINGCVSDVCEYSYTITEKPNIVSTVINGEEMLFTDISEAVKTADSYGEATTIRLLSDINVIDVECELKHVLDLNNFNVGTLTVTGDARILNGSVTNLYVSGAIETENVTVEETDAMSYGVSGEYGIYTSLELGVSIIDGAQVRIGGGVAEKGIIDSESGLRFIGQNNMSDTLSGIVISEYFHGKEYSDGYSIGVEITAEGNENAIYIPALKWQDESNGIFSAAVTNLESSNFNRKYTARVYVEYNNVKLFNSSSITRSIYCVAAGLLMKSSDEDTEKFINVLNAYVNQTGIRLVVKDGELMANTKYTANGSYKLTEEELHFTVSGAEYDEAGNSYSVILTAQGNAEIITDGDYWYDYIRINNNNSLVRDKVTVELVDGNSKAVKLTFKADGLIQRPTDKNDNKVTDPGDGDFDTESEF